MKSKKKYFIIGSILFVILVAILVFMYFYFTDKSRLNSEEKRYVANNSSKVQNLNVLNDASIFGDNGNGVFYDFLDDFYKEQGIKINPVTYNKGEATSNIAFTISNSYKEDSEDEFLFYKDHYVLVSKKEENFSDISHLKNLKIGILNENLSHIGNYIDNSSLTIQTYQTEEELLQAFATGTDIEYMVTPLTYHMDVLLKNNYYVAHHFSDIPCFYKVDISKDKVLGSILRKFYEKWANNKFSKSYNTHEFKLFTDSLNISQTEVDAMQSITYQYGFITNSPYEILSGGNYGGIIAQYLKEFIDFSNTEISFTRYKNYKKLDEAIKKENVDMYFAFYQLSNNFNNVPTNIGLNFSVIADKSMDIVVRSLKSLNDKIVYVEENSTIYDYLKNNSKMILKTYKNEKQLKQAVKDDEIIIVDNNVYYSNRFGIFNEYSVRYNETVDTDYFFRTDANATFTKLFAKFINMKDPLQTEYKGIYNYELTFRTGNITGAIAKYFMYILIIVVLIFFYVYKATKKVRLTKKIKKEDKLKYVDQLTSLKNRNYLSENLDNWSSNTIYPQATIVIDLNNLQYINDTMGYEKGDEQIKAAANILVKTQLDKSDIIRTDGNEFVIYLVGYEQKQIASYINKLTKEFKKLPYEQGATIAYSMILDNIKSVEDAINEALEEIKRQKENKKEEN